MTRNAIEASNIGVKFDLSKKTENTKSLISRLISSTGGSSEEYWALEDVSFNVKKGEVLGVIGRNGAGKSTLLRVIGGIYEPDTGSINVRHSVSTILSITAGFRPNLTGIENIYLRGVLMGFDRHEINESIDSIRDFSGLDEFLYSPVKTYSTGMKSRLGFAIAVYLRREIILIDEVLGVGDTEFREKCDKKIEELMESNHTIVLVSHNNSTIGEYADKAILLIDGKVRSIGEPEDVIETRLNME